MILGLIFVLGAQVTAYAQDVRQKNKWIQEYWSVSGEVLKIDSLSLSTRKKIDAQLLKLNGIQRKIESAGGLSAAMQARVDRVQQHVVDLRKRVLKSQWIVGMELVSWQSQGVLVGSGERFTLLATQLGFSPSITFQQKNARIAYGATASGVLGSAGVSTLNGGPVYSQSDVPAWGGRIALFGAWVVSETGTEVGLRTTVWWVQQTFATPSTAGYTVEQPKALALGASLFSRYWFKNWGLSIEFGKRFGVSAPAWGLGGVMRL